MKRILITGENSYIGNSFLKYISKFPDDYIVDTISVRGKEWKNVNFSEFDSVIHLAGIVHKRNVNSSIYYSINTALSEELAKKSKYDGVKQFIYFSSMSVFGTQNGEINKGTECNPQNHYGKSKLLAENILLKLSSDSFKVAIVRPPMVYGEHAPGNYKKLKILSRYAVMFPNSNNKRSMISSNLLSKHIKKLVDTNFYGYYHPQDAEYINTSFMIRNLRLKNNKETYLVKMFFLKKIKISIINKVFGDLYYGRGFYDLL
ncbi:UDP-glucose 4-epimerase [Enterococcus sp. AZ095a]|uniref:NAD-dependent epimerase/dehydratase family protein n=1 Tax=Enterococcus sp. AZ095a TaxID=2774718 RepID=UPI003D2FC5B4